MLLGTCDTLVDFLYLRLGLCDIFSGNLQRNIILYICRIKKEIYIYAMLLELLVQYLEFVRALGQLPKQVLQEYCVRRLHKAPDHPDAVTQLGDVRVRVLRQGVHREFLEYKGRVRRLLDVLLCRLDLFPEGSCDVFQELLNEICLLDLKKKKEVNSTRLMFIFIFLYFYIYGI